MFSPLASMLMAAKLQFTQLKYPILRRQDKTVSEYLYKNDVDKQEVKEKYEKSILPESGYMTVEEYESKSRAKTKREISAKILKEPEFPKDENMVYIPQHKFKLVKYNDPAGCPELTLPRKLNFDRQINAQGIVSGDYKKLVYPAVYYYAEGDCTSCDLFLINLNPTLPNVEKVQRANVLNKEPEPLISTSKDIDEKFVFRTLTPIDFSSDNSKLVIKEKIGYRHDGIWKTELWVYDFNKKQAKRLPQIRDAIVTYWEMNSGVDFDYKRWDIYPMGFDANNENRIVVCAYAYTGDVPKFLGTWSIDMDGENTKLESLTSATFPVSIIGYKLVEDSEVTPISEIEFEAKMAKEKEKTAKKQEKADKKLDEEIKRLEYVRKTHEMDMETMIKIQEREKKLKEAKPKTKTKETVTGEL